MLLSLSWMLGTHWAVGARRSKKIVEGAGKRAVLLLNKIDLIPRHNVQEWLRYFRAQQPTLAFKASLQSQRQRLKQSKVDPTEASERLLTSGECLGADTLIQLLKNYARSTGRKTAMTVGLVGYPNVGKSSVINSLKRSRVVEAGATPGLTKTTQEVKLDKLIKLMDCPGIVFSKGEGPDHALRNCLKVEKLMDPVAPIESIVGRCSHENLRKLYGVDKFTDHTSFLAAVARKRGKLKKGGLLDLDGTARLVLVDWNSGKIPFYTVPPKDINANAMLGEATVVGKWAREFDMEKVFQDEEKVIISSLPEQVAVQSMDVEGAEENTKKSKTRVPQSLIKLADANQAPESDKKSSRDVTLRGVETEALQLKREKQREKEKRKWTRRARDDGTTVPDDEDDGSFDGGDGDEGVSSGEHAPSRPVVEMWEMRDGHNGGDDDDDDD
eukprot:Rmarinus@m.27103